MMQGKGISSSLFFFFAASVAATLATISHMPLCLSTEHYMHAHENLIPLWGKEKDITGGFVSHLAGSGQSEIKRTVQRHICGCVC